jgi:putative ABC transport system ATP-binding protein
MAAWVTLRGVARPYVRGTERIEALREIDLEIAPGAFVALLGPAGAGKTTLLNIIAGLDTPHTGAVVVAGERLDTLGPRELADWRARHVGFVFYVDSLVPALTLEHNVEIPLLAQPLTRYERRREVLAALDSVGLLRRAQCLPAQLTPGQRRRVAIARALVTRPSLLVCDEPTSNLCADTTEDILEVLHEVSARRDTTLVMATDDPTAAAWASQVIEMECGRASLAYCARVAA